MILILKSSTYDDFAHLCRRAEDMPRKRGGYRKPKLTEEHVERLVAFVEENPVITLSDMKSKLELEFGFSINIKTIHNYLESKFYTVKKILSEPPTMNSEINKEKRKTYMQALMEKMGQGKFIVFMDQSKRFALFSLPFTYCYFSSLFI